MYSYSCGPYIDYWKYRGTYLYLMWIQTGTYVSVWLPLIQRALLISGISGRDRCWDKIGWRSHLRQLRHAGAKQRLGLGLRVDRRASAEPWFHVLYTWRATTLPHGDLPLHACGGFCEARMHRSMSSNTLAQTPRPRRHLSRRAVFHDYVSCQFLSAQSRLKESSGSSGKLLQHTGRWVHPVAAWAFRYHHTIEKGTMLKRLGNLWDAMKTTGQ